MKRLTILLLFALAVIASSCGQSGQSSDESNEETSANTRLHDIWVLEKIEGNALDTTGLPERPRLEINLTDMRLMGFDGCNNFNGSIKTADDESLGFGPIAGTRKMCANMQVPDKMNQLITQVQAYKLDGLKLHLYGENDKLLLSFQKTD